jgi:predicted small integral membrane protein
MAEPVPLPACWIANAWNCAAVFSAVGLMLKTMPLPQWPF